MLTHLRPQLGRIPAEHGRRLPDNASQIATNTKFWSGTLSPFKDVSTVAAPTKTGTKKTIYYAPIIKSGTRYWYHWIDDVVVAESPVEDQTENLVYFAGDSSAVGKMRYTYLPAAVTGGTNYPINSWDLGVVSPASEPSLATSGAGSGGALDVSYAYRYVAKTAGGVSMPGPISSIATISRESGQSINVTMATSYVGGGTHQVTHKQIMRTVPGDSSGLLYLVGEVTLATSVFNDATTDATALTLPTVTVTNLAPPPDDAHSIVMLPNGVAVVASGREVRPSEPWMPHAYPPDYRQMCDFDTVGLGVYGTECIVLTTGIPYILRGSTSSTMTMDRTSMTQSCTSRRSIVSSKYGVVYACPDGLNLISQGTDRLLTKDIIDRETWQSLDPTSVLGVVYDGRYHGFYDNGVTQAGFIFDFEDGSWIDTDVFATAAFVDPINDALYLQVGSNVVKWEGGVSKKTYTYRSPKIKVITPPTAFRVIADDYTALTLKLYADGVLKATKAVTSASVGRLPNGYKPSTIEVQLEGTAAGVASIYLADSVEEVIEVGG